MTEPVVDAWLSELMERPAFHLDPSESPAIVMPGPAFADVKVPATDLARVNIFVAAGFVLADTAVTLNRPADAATPADRPRPVRPARPDDMTAVGEIAASAFRFDRFHADPEISTDVADKIKKTWATNFFRGLRGERMIIATDGHRVVGFLQVIDRPALSIIDLIAVAPGAQGRRFATAMIEDAIRSGPRVAWRVGTQIANAASLRLYENLGFQVTSSQHVLHRHFH